MNKGASSNFSYGYREQDENNHPHPSVTSLLRSVPGHSDPEAVVRQKCREIVQMAKADGWSGPPFCPFQLASLRGIKVRKVTQDIAAEARIFGIPSQVVIEYRPDMALEERLRFSIFHEIVHTIFPDCYEIVRHSQAKNSAMTEPQKAFERLCDVGAGELLMPHEDFTRDFGTTLFTLKEVCGLKKRYMASTEATVKRCLGLTNLSRAAVFFHNQIGGLTVKYYWKGGGFRWFIPPGSTPPVDSVVHKLAAEDIDLPTPASPQKEIWTNNGRSRAFHVQAISLPKVENNPEYPKAMALLVDGD